MRPQRLVSAWVSPGEPEQAGGGTLLQRSAAVPGSTKVGARSRLGRARAAKRTRSMDADYEGCQAGWGWCVVQSGNARYLLGKPAEAPRKVCARPSLGEKILIWWSWGACLYIIVYCWTGYNVFFPNKIYSRFKWWI